MDFLAAMFGFGGMLLFAFGVWFVTDVLLDIPARPGTVRCTLKPMAYSIQSKLARARAHKRP